MSQNTVNGERDDGANTFSPNEQLVQFQHSFGSGISQQFGSPYQSQLVFDGFQEGNTCAPHAIANVIESVEENDSKPEQVIELASELGLLTDSGMSVDGIVNVFEHSLVPVDVQAGPNIRENLEALLDSGRPVLMAVDASDHDGTSGALWNEKWTPEVAIGFEGIDPPDHAIVVHGIQNEFGVPHAVFSDSAGHVAYQSIPLEQLIDAADGGGGIMVSPVIPVGGFAREFETPMIPEQKDLIDLENYSSPYQDLKDAFMEPSLNSANGSSAQTGAPSSAFDAAYGTQMSSQSNNANDFRDEFTQFLENPPASANPMTVNVVDAMNSQMVNNQVPMTESHYQAAVQSIEKGDSLWGFLQAENSHVLESTGSGFVYDAGKFFHEGIHAAESAQQAVSNFIDQTKDAFSSAKESILSPFQQEPQQAPSLFDSHPSDPFSSGTNNWDNSQQWSTPESSSGSNSTNSSWGWGASQESHAPAFESTNNWGSSSFDSGYSSHDSGYSSHDSGSSSSDSSSHDSGGSDSSE